MITRILDDIEELQKYIIISIYGQPISGALKFQKIMYLISNMNKDVGKMSGFEAGIYGPYSEIVDVETLYLEQIGVLTQSASEITLTPLGEKIAQILSDTVDKHTKYIISKYRDMVNSMTKPELLAFFYTAYPDMVEHSAHYDAISSDVEKHILSIAKKEIITSQRAAELLHQTQHHVIKKIKPILPLD